MTAPTSGITGRITHWQKQTDNRVASVKALDYCIINAIEEIEELKALRKNAKESVESSEERLDYWLKQYESEQS